MNVTNVTMNNECTVTRMLVNKKSYSRTEFLFEYRVIFNSKFLFKNRIVFKQTFVNRGLTVINFCYTL